MLSFTQGRSSSAQVKAAPCLASQLEAEGENFFVVLYTEDDTNSLDLR